MSNKVAEVSNKLMERAARSADSAIRSTQRGTQQAMEGVSHSLQAARKQVRKGANVASDKTIAYIHKEPVKSMFIAAALGAALVALPSVLSRINRSRG